MKKEIFSGVCTALVTPFAKNKKIDYVGLKSLVLRQIENKVSGILILGTTGEGSTISFSEREKIIKFVKKLMSPPTKLFVGAGCNNTSLAIKYVRQAERLKVDGVLVVTPYYNKCNQNGAISHYTKIANSTSLPLILYNVPSRTGFNLSPESVLELSKTKNIVGIKEASENLAHIKKLVELVGDKLAIYSGSDGLNRYFLSNRASGMISVLSNIYPNKLIQQYESFQNGSYATYENNLSNYSKALFVDVNPIPVKYVLYKMGLIGYNFRLPLTPTCHKNEKLLEKIFML